MFHNQSIAGKLYPELFSNPVFRKKYEWASLWQMYTRYPKYFVHAEYSTAILAKNIARILSSKIPEEVKLDMLNKRHKKLFKGLTPKKIQERLTRADVPEDLIDHVLKLIEESSKKLPKKLPKRCVLYIKKPIDQTKDK